MEGLWEKLASFCQDNPHVSLEDGGRLVVRPGATFVYGGDALDRGPDGRRVVRTLLDARREFPTQVVLLAGNRDINKLRLVRELNGHPLARTPEDMRRAPRPVLLRWIFANTMGARGAFEFRHAELAREDSTVSEEDVVDSFLEDRLPGRAARLPHRVPAGAPHRQHPVRARRRARGEPRLRARAGPGGGVDAWREALNGWYAGQLAAFAEGRLEGGVPDWEPLIAYQAPIPGQRVNPASVVYGRMADANNHPGLPSPGSSRRSPTRASTGSWWGTPRAGIVPRCCARGASSSSSRTTPMAGWRGPRGCSCATTACAWRATWCWRMGGTSRCASSSRSRTPPRPLAGRCSTPGTW
ncbi:hypothetical protein ACN28S_24270 [Cystobacter fuscus]